MIRRRGDSAPMTELPKLIVETAAARTNSRRESNEAAGITATPGGIVRQVLVLLTARRERLKQNMGRHGAQDFPSQRNRIGTQSVHTFTFEVDHDGNHPLAARLGV